MTGDDSSRRPRYPAWWLCGQELAKVERGVNAHALDELEVLLVYVAQLGGHERPHEVVDGADLAQIVAVLQNQRS